MATSVGELEVKLKGNTLEFDESLDKAEKKTRSFGEIAREAIITNVAQRAFGAVADAISSTMSKMSDFARSTVEIGKTFDSSMSNVAAISGATGSEIDALRDKAKEMGAATKYTATDAADAMSYMAMAGWKTEDMLNGVSGVMNLAAASGADLAEASDIVTDALTAFGQGAGESARLADIMAAASANSNTNVHLLGETFKYVAPVAGALGYSMEDTAVAIGLMANAGIKGSQSGTALRTLLTNLASPTDTVKAAMDSLSISLTNADGTMKPMNQVLGDLRTGFSGLSEEERAATAAAIAGKEGMSGLLAIVGASDADFNSLTAAINGSAGAAEKMAYIMIDNLAGAQEMVSSKSEALKLSLYEGVEPALTAVTKAGGAVLGALSGASGSMEVLNLASEEVISSVNNMASTLPGIIQDMAQRIPGIIDAILPAISAAIPQVISTIVQIIPMITQTLLTMLPTLINLGIQLISSLIEGIATMLPQIVTQIVEIIPQIIYALTAPENLQMLLQAALDLLMALVDAIPQIVIALVNALPIIIENILTFILDPANILMIMEAAIQLFMGLVKAVPQVLGALIGAIGSILSSVLNKIVEFAPQLIAKGVEMASQFLQNVVSFFSQLPGRIGEFIGNALSAVGEWVGNMVNKAVEVGGQFLENVVSFISQLPGNIWSFLTDTISKVGSFAADFASKALKAGQDFFTKIVDEVGKIPGRMLEIGGNIVKGIGEGIMNGIGWLTNKISEFAGGVMDSIKGFFGIHSPSTLMRDQVGKFLAEGIGVGFSDEMDNVSKEMAEAVSIPPVSMMTSWENFGRFEAGGEAEGETEAITTGVQITQYNTIENGFDVEQMNAAMLAAMRGV